ncbi:unnamed protein product [Moneuplotes crassus]|uniref:Uncharacterized protein n=1 Tax=Euplotes crassus TaxID=5936 RepID=A0AAD1XX64_EUPCR|nr:unnamed protein product [Moneuplotes crassus]
MSSEGEDSQNYQFQDENLEFDEEESDNNLDEVISNANKQLKSQEKEIQKLEDQLKQIEDQDNEMTQMRIRCEMVQQEIDELNNPNTQTLAENPLLVSITDYTNKNKQFEKIFGKFREVSAGLDKANDLHHQKVLHLEDGFKNLENILMCVDKSVSKILENPIDIQDEQLEKDIEYMNEERKNHRSSLIKLIDSITNINVEENDSKEQINRLSEIVKK